MQTSAYLVVVWDISATRRMPQDMAGFLEVFKTRLDGAWSKQVQWSMSLPRARSWNEMNSEVVFSPNHSGLCGGC